MSNYEKDLQSIFDKYADRISIHDRRQLREILNETIALFQRELIEENVDWSEIGHPTTKVATEFISDLADISIAHKLDTEEIIDLDERALLFLSQIRAHNH